MPPAEDLSAPASVAHVMAAAALAWQATLSDEQRSHAAWPSPTSRDPKAADRVLWYYTPTDHGGLTLGAQRPQQQRLALRLVATGLSDAAFVTVATVMGLENVLDRLENWTRDWGFERGRDPSRYWLRVFGEPGPSGVWGWRFGGHHVSLNYLVVDGRVVSTTPCFIGADPASSPLLGDEELRPLGSAEDLARKLLGSLRASQRGAAVIHPRAPADIVSGNRPFVEAGNAMIHVNDPALWRATMEEEPLRLLADTMDEAAERVSGYDADDHRAVALRDEFAGIPGSDLDEIQRTLLRRLVAVYEGRAPEALWTPHTDVELDGVHFAWAGATRQGQPHYYRLQGSELLVEYDNTQRDANHAHSVWRKPAQDFGRDALDAHVREWHRPG